VATPESSRDSLPKTVSPSEYVTYPVGVGEPLLSGATKVAIVTSWPKSDGSGYEYSSTVLVRLGLTVCVSGVTLLLVPQRRNGISRRGEIVYFLRSSIMRRRSCNAREGREDSDQ
jgi:hypothetical protein